MKIVVVGGGSTYTPELIDGVMARATALDVREIWLVDPNADMQLYYKSVVEVLNATPPGAFTPTLQQLDALIQSMLVTP